jgi:hypothetical protein
MRVSTRDDIHRLVDEVPAEWLPSAGAFLRQLAGGHRDAPARRHLSFVGTLDAEPDLAERSAEILREELGGTQ